MIILAITALHAVALRLLLRLETLQLFSRQLIKTAPRLLLLERPLVGLNDVIPFAVWKAAKGLAPPAHELVRLTLA